MAYHRHHDLDVRIVRIFNTYGERQRADDGRAVSNFLVQALRGDPITVFGDGKQTRSFCYVDDEVRGFLALLDGDITGPVNIGNPGEYTILQLAEMAIEVTDSSSPIVFEPLPVDDPTQRQPDLTLARSALGWEPEIPLRTGLERTAAYFRMYLAPLTPPPPTPPPSPPPRAAASCGGPRPAPSPPPPPPPRRASAALAHCSAVAGRARGVWPTASAAFQLTPGARLGRWRRHASGVQRSSRTSGLTAPGRRRDPSSAGRRPAACSPGGRRAARTTDARRG